ncbi:nucleotidyltransferase family protein [Ancylobacter sp.]|uniref:nucleotidyltransferase family protein n=1 Tax=Ancylobacter sp. TaxID=1872567 RepID=UPI003D0D11A4
MPTGTETSPLRRAPSWPDGWTDLLLRATLAPDDIALGAWRRWSAMRDLSDITPHETKLLAPLGLRLATLDPDAPLRPSVERLVRTHWLHTQLKIGETIPALDILLEAGITFMVFKGAAQYAEGLAAASRRLMGDVDVLVSPAQSTAALTALDAADWEHVDGTSTAYLKGAETALQRGNLRKGRYGEIDFHTRAFHYASNSARLETALWDAAVPATLAGRRLLVPSPTDSLLIILAHAAVGRGAAWAVDVMTRMERQAIDWDRLVRIARERGLVPSCLAGLGYMRQALCAPVPPEVIADLAASSASVGEKLKYRAHIRDWEDRTLLDRATDRVANRLLVKRGFPPIVDGRPTRPGAPLRWRFGRRTPVADSGGVADRHEIRPGNLEGRSEFVLRLAVERPKARRWVFIETFADGRSVARLAFKTGSSKRSGATERLFHVKLPRDNPAPGALVLVSRPTCFLSPSLPDADRCLSEPLPFRIAGVWAL